MKGCSNVLRGTALQGLVYLARQACAPFDGAAVGHVHGNGAIGGVAVVVLDD